MNSVMHNTIIVVAFAIAILAMMILFGDSVDCCKRAGNSTETCLSTLNP